MGKNFVLMLVFLFSAGVQAAITATDADGNDFTLNLAPGQETIIQIQLDAEDGDEITSARVYGSGLTLVSDCVQTFSEGNTQCIAELQVEASSNNSITRVEFRTNTSPSRLRQNVTVNRNASAPIDPSDYTEALSSSTGSELDFGVVNDKVNQRIYITNSGNQPTDTIAPIDLETDGYRVLSNTCSGRVIGAGNTCRLIIEFDSSGLFSGDHLDAVKIHPITDDSSPLVVTLKANIPAAPATLVEVDAGFNKVDPTACLALNGINPSACYYEADLPTSGETTISGVSCVGSDPAKCSVLISKKVANEPVEFLISVKYDDNVLALDPTNYDHSITPAPVSMGTILVGAAKTQVYTITNTHSTSPLELPIEVSLEDPEDPETGVLSEAQITSNTCSLRSTALPVGQSCQVSVEVSPSEISTNREFLVKVEATGNERTSSTTFSGGDPTVRHQVQLSIAGTGSVSSPSLSCSNLDQPCSGLIEQGATLTFTATEELNASVFETWGGDCSFVSGVQTCEITVDAPKNISVEFTPVYQLQLATTGSGVITSDKGLINCGDSNTDCSDYFKENESIVLTATPTNGEFFDAWTGACLGQDETCELTISQAETLSVGFVSSLPLTITKSGGDGTVVSSEHGINCGVSCSSLVIPGSTVVLTVSADNGYYFKNWTGGPCAGQDSLTCSFTMDTPISMEAVYAADPGKGIPGSFGPSYTKIDYRNKQLFDGDTLYSLAPSDTASEGLQIWSTDLANNTNLKMTSTYGYPTKEKVQMTNEEYMGGLTSDGTYLYYFYYTAAEGTHLIRWTIGQQGNVGPEPSNCAYGDENPNPCWIIKPNDSFAESVDEYPEMKKIGANIFFKMKQNLSDSNYKMFILKTDQALDTSGGSCSTIANPCSLSNDSVSSFSVVDGKIYYGAVDGLGHDLFEVDGASSTKVADLSLSTTSSTGYTSEVVKVGSDLMFLAGDTANGSLELWKISGAVASLVKDISSEIGVSAGDVLKGRNMVSAHGKAFFVADLQKSGGLHTQNIWSSDGTVGGTLESMDLNPGVSVASVDIGSSANQLTIAADINDDTGKELWVYDSSIAISSGGAADCPSARNPCRVESAPGFPDARVDVDNIYFESNKFYLNSISTVQARRLQDITIAPYLDLEETLSVVDMGTKQLSNAEFFTSLTSTDPFYTYLDLIDRDLCEIRYNGTATSRYDHAYLIEAMDDLGIGYSGNFSSDCSSYASWLSSRTANPSLGNTIVALTELFRYLIPSSSSSYGFPGQGNSGIIVSGRVIGGGTSGEKRIRINMSKIKKHNGIFYLVATPTVSRGHLRGDSPLGDGGIAGSPYGYPQLVSFANVETHTIPRIEKNQYPALALSWRGATVGIVDRSRSVNYVGATFVFNQPVRITSSNVTDYGSFNQTPERFIPFNNEEYEFDPHVSFHSGGLGNNALRMFQLEVESVNEETVFDENGTRTPR